MHFMFRNSWPYATWRVRARCSIVVSGATSLPVVGAERLSRKAVFVEEIGPGESVAPGIANGGGLGDAWARYDDGVAFDMGVSPNKFLVLTGAGEALQFIAVLEGEALADMGEFEGDRGYRECVIGYSAA